MIEDPYEQSRAEYDAYQGCKHAGKHVEAREWLLCSRANKVKAVGDDSPEVEKYDKLLKRKISAPHVVI